MNHIQFVAKRLRDLRARHALTQTQCAELAGMNFDFYQRLESGCKKQIWMETVIRLAAAFGLGMHEFLAPELPKKTVLKRKPKPSTIHNQRRRPGPHLRRAK